MNAWEWALLALAALLVGVAKTAIPGVSTVSVALFASVLPARESTASLLLLLLVGDALALLAYRRHADWKTLVGLIGPVLIGVLCGVWFLAAFDDDGVKRVIGVILLVTVVLSLWIRHRRSRTASRGSRSRMVLFGAAGGFTTMVANAGGPVMSMYFLASQFDMKRFLGTAAWFFAAVNVIKLPFAVGLGLVGAQTVVMAAVLVPAVLMGGLAGRALIARLRQEAFDQLVLVFTVVGAAYLLIA